MATILCAASQATDLIERHDHENEDMSRKGAKALRKSIEIESC